VSDKPPGWKDRFNQLKTWVTATPEVQYQPRPGTEPVEPSNEKDVFEKGRDIWNDWVGSKNPSAPLPEIPRQPPVPHVKPPSEKQVSPPPVTPVQTPSASPPVTPPKTQLPPNPKTRQPHGSVVTEPPPDRVIESRIYQTMLVPRFVADTIRQYFLSQGCEGQILEKGGVWVCQGKKGEPRQTADGGLAATIVIERSGPSLRVSIGGGAWIGQGSPVAAGADTAASLITGPIGMGRQKTLVDILWGIVEGLVTRSNGCRIA
jgi:hypothetical protein